MQNKDITVINIFTTFRLNARVLRSSRVERIPGICLRHNLETITEYITTIVSSGKAYSVVNRIRVKSFGAVTGLKAGLHSSIQCSYPSLPTMTLWAYKNGAITDKEITHITSKMILATKNESRRLNGNTMAQKRSNEIAKRVRIELPTETLWKNTTILQMAGPKIHLKPKYTCVIIFGIQRMVINRSLAARFAMKRFVTLRILLFRQTVIITIEFPTSERKMIIEYARVFATCVTTVSWCNGQVQSLVSFVVELPPSPGFSMSMFRLLFSSTGCLQIDILTFPPSLLII